MNRRIQAASPRHRILVSGALVAVAALLLALPSLAAELRQVRVGAHKTFTRVVFELDHAAGYRVETFETGGATELRVTVDAASGSHKVGAHGDVRGVTVAPGANAVARIPLRRSGLRLKEMILANPARIVIDLSRPQPVAATKPAPKPAPVAVKPKPAPKPAPVAVTPKPAPKPAPVAVKPKPAPKPEPVAVKPVPKPAPVAVTPKPEPKPALVAVEPEPKPALVAVEPEPKPGPEDEPAEATPPVVPGQIARPAKPAEPIARAVKPAKPYRPAPAPKFNEIEIETEPEADSGSGWVSSLPGSPMMLGAVAGGLVALVGIVFTLRRRGRKLPGDLDAAAIAEELDGDDGAALGGMTAPETVTESAGAESSFQDFFDDRPEPVAETPAEMPSAAPAAAPPTPIDLSDEPAPGSEPPPIAGPEFDVEAPVEHATAPDSIFEEASSQGETPMNQDMDLPADRSGIAPPPPAMGASELGASPDVAAMLEAFERRIQGLESKLDAANEAREKLERQVAAQSEELRVQRAAIARTQRALRTMSRGDEEKATEPALREGETQAKTRVNV